MLPLFPQQVAQEYRAVSPQCNASRWTLSGSLTPTFNFHTEDTCFFASGDLLFGGEKGIYCNSKPTCVLFWVVLTLIWILTETFTETTPCGLWYGFSCVLSCEFNDVCLTCLFVCLFVFIPCGIFIFDCNVTINYRHTIMSLLKSSLYMYLQNWILFVFVSLIHIPAVSEHLVPVLTLLACQVKGCSGRTSSVSFVIVGFVQRRMHEGHDIAEDVCPSHSWVKLHWSKDRRTERNWKVTSSNLPLTSQVFLI